MASTSQQLFTANDIQIGGNHYQQFGALQPWDVTLALDLGFLRGNFFKYLVRWKHKDGVEALRKAGHYLDKFIEYIEPHGDSINVPKFEPKYYMHVWQHFDLDTFQVTLFRIVCYGTTVAEMRAGRALLDAYIKSVDPRVPVRTDGVAPGDD